MHPANTDTAVDRCPKSIMVLNKSATFAHARCQRPNGRAQERHLSAPFTSFCPHGLREISDKAIRRIASPEHFDEQTDKRWGSG